MVEGSVSQQSDTVQGTTGVLTVSSGEEGNGLTVRSLLTQ